MTESSKRTKKNDSKNKLLLILGVLLMVVVSWFSLLDKAADDYLDESLGEAVKSFAIARSVNASISVIQSSEVSIGVASVQLGEALDPINDSVERFSDLITVAIGSIVIQVIMLEIISSTFFKVALTLSGTLLIGAILIKEIPFKKVIIKSFVFLTLLRVSMSFVVLMSSAVDQFFIEERREYDTNKLAEAEKKLQDEANKEASRLNALMEENAALESKNKILNSKIVELTESLVIKRNELSVVKSEIERASEGIGMFDSVPQKLKEKKERRSSIEEIIERQEDMLEETSSQIEDNEELINDNIEAINDGPGFFSKLYTSGKSVINSFTSINWETISNASENFLYLMVIWVFKTIIIPIIFLLSMLKVFRAIWGMEFKEAFKKQEDYLRSSLPHKS